MGKTNLTSKQRSKGGKKKPEKLRPDWAKHLVEDWVLRKGGIQQAADWMEKHDPKAITGMVAKFLPQHIVLGGDPKNPLKVEGQLPDDLKELIQKMRGEPDAE